MTNKEKAMEIAEKSKEYFYHTESDCGFACALKMAQWKDEQFKVEIRKLKSKIYSIIDDSDMLSFLSIFEGFEKKFKK